MKLRFFELMFSCGPCLPQSGSKRCWVVVVVVVGGGGGGGSHDVVGVVMCGGGGGGLCV